MHDFLELGEFTGDGLRAMLDAATAVKQGTLAQDAPLAGRTILTIFPEASMRTRVTFEAGAKRLGATHVWLPPAILERSEPLADVAGYLDCWVELAVIRYPRLGALRELAGHMAAPVVNAMTGENHPCEIMADLLTLREDWGDLESLQLVFIGPRGNVANSWVAAAAVMRLSLTQICPPGYEVDARRFALAGPAALGRIAVTSDLASGVAGADAILTDCWPAGDFDAVREAFLPYQVTSRLMELTGKPAARLYPCPPVTRGREVSAEVMNSRYFAGYGAKANLLPVQQAILLSCLGLV